MGKMEISVGALFWSGKATTEGDLLLYLRKKHYVVLSIRLGALGAGGVREVEFFQCLPFPRDVLLHFFGPLTGVLVRPFEHFCEECSGDRCHFGTGYIFGNIDVDIAAPEGLLIPEHQLIGRLCMSFLNECHISYDHLPRVERDMEKARHVVFHEELILPRDFLVFPRFGIERIAAAGGCYGLITHTGDCTPYPIAESMLIPNCSHCPWT